MMILIGLKGETHHLIRWSEGEKSRLPEVVNIWTEVDEVSWDSLKAKETE